MDNFRSRLYNILFVLVLLVAAYFRLMGLNWDQSQHLHPDERFLTMVSTSLMPVNGPGEYFDTANSSLNPHNRGHGFYVYGTLPVFIVRYVAEGMSEIATLAAEYVQDNPEGALAPMMQTIGKTTTWAGYDEITLVGRVFAALSDLGAIILLYVIARRLYNQKVAVLAAAFTALSVMLIQQSHFYTTDAFANFFIFLAVFFAVEVMVGNDTGLDTSSVQKVFESALRSPLIWNVFGFGLALGMAVASKLNAAPLAVLLPGALFVRYFRERNQPVDAPEAHAEQLEPEPLPVDEIPDGEAPLPELVVSDLPIVSDPLPVPPQRKTLSLEYGLVLLLLGAFFAVLSFRIFQPYAFRGEFGFFDVRLNERWVQNISDQRAQASGDVDFPPALQWARRPVWFSGYNLVAWGLGWPLGVLAWVGFLYMGWRILKGDWKEHILLWSWTGAYFLWQTTQWNPTMRYQLPIYPLLALMAAWFLVAMGRWKIENKDALPVFSFRWVAVGLGAIVLAGTLAWTYAYTRIYTREHSRVQATHWIFQNVPGPYNLRIEQPDGTLHTQPQSLPYGTIFSPDVPYDSQFSAFVSGNLTEITLGHALDPVEGGGQLLTVYIGGGPGFETSGALASGSLRSDFRPLTNPRGEFYTIKLDRPVVLEKGRTYYIRLVTNGTLALSGSAPVHETSWDDGLPLRMDGYDAYGGIYQGDLNFEMYFDDNADKLERFVNNLNTGDYVFITSNRQWATTTRVPERYPLTTAYYRNLVGCPEEQDVIWCYNVAEPGMFTGNLGFELVKTFTSYPALGSWEINTQFAEEAFTVYDAPKVLIFKKTANYDPQAVRNLLSKVDLSNVAHITPRQASRYRGDLTLPKARLEAQRAGGTWSELFSYEYLQNRYPVLGLLLWYFALGLLGLFTWPILRLLLPGLSDKGYPLGRLSGLLLLAYFSWLVGSLGGTFSRGVIVAGYGLIVVGGVVAFFAQKDQIREEMREKGKYFLVVEGLFLLLFLVDLGIRLGNPDLWHPAKGGERPMDFSYLNAVLKSTSFPPYDPWFAGGYINYYYWGYVLVGTPIKMLGIVPSIAYNFVLPSLFAMLGIGGFSVAWNLVAGLQPKEIPGALSKFWLQVLSGLGASAALVLIGNLGTIRLIYQALQKMAVSNEVFEGEGVWIFQRWGWALQGLGKLLSFSGQSLPVGWGEWYWNPSRVMPGGDLAITEFPLFTFLYSDLHAHMIALPLTVLVVAWAVSTLMARNLSRWQWLATLAFGGLVIGSLRPTNTWDFPTYLALGALVTGYSIFRYVEVSATRFGLSPLIQRAILALVGMAALAGFALLLFEPYAHWYALGYTNVSRWDNEKTPIWSYLTHWGLFLFVIVSWIVWETRQWMAQTPVSALAKLKPYEVGIELALAVVIGLTLALQFILKVSVAWLAFPLAAWALVLMLRPGQPDAKRLVLFMVGTGLVLTLVVETIVLVGDIGRMNTVFKFYLQVWVLFAVSAAAAFGWLLNEFDEWSSGWRTTWYVVGTLLFAGAFLFLFTGGMDKIRDRMTADVPFTFDALTYMEYSKYWDQEDMLLGEDYRAIRWMQDNIQGSPVILEAAPAGVQYTWFSRYAIYTGLPTVVGWQWHQQQQRVVLPPTVVSDRGLEAQEFYRTNDQAMVKDFLEKYAVRYIVVGQLERIKYPEGLAKFESWDGALWKKIYQDGRTTIYEVVQ